MIGFNNLLSTLLRQEMIEIRNRIEEIDQYCIKCGRSIRYHPSTGRFILLYYITENVHGTLIKNLKIL
jgi:hypothetical protein